MLSISRFSYSRLPPTERRCEQQLGPWKMEGVKCIPFEPSDSLPLLPTMHLQYLYFSISTKKQISVLKEQKHKQAVPWKAL